MNQKEQQGGIISVIVFIVIAGSIISGSNIYIENIGLNQTRTGILEVLELTKLFSLRN